MKKLLLCLILTLCSPAGIFAQNIVLAGEVTNADTVSVRVYSNGSLILTQRIVDPVYALIIGQHPHYTIEFEWRGTLKYAHLYTYGMNAETISLPVDFGTKSNVIIVKDAGGLMKKISRSFDQYTYIYYGYHASRKKF
jgi:hypothetical protein